MPETMLVGKEIIVIEWEYLLEAVWLCVNYEYLFEILKTI